jgi:Flp pilus assembly protein TadD
LLKAVELNPNNAGPHNNLGILLSRTGRTDEAIAQYRKAMEISPLDIGILGNLVFALEQNGQLTEATLVVQNALASAKSAGDKARVKTIAHILAKIHENADSLQVNSRTHVQ